jgi:2-polyprenyl-6-methoxyphenol hydroxylase-like FAD-dependent oxidoreductase
VAQQKKLVADACHGMGWRTPELLEAMWAAPDFYFDPIAQIHLERFARGRIALLGDAGYGATLGGLGTGQALVAAYVLAGELAAAGGDHRAAYARYEHQIRDFARGCQKIAGNAGSFMAPSSPAKIRQRNLMYRVLSAGDGQADEQAHHEGRECYPARRLLAVSSVSRAMARS